MMGMGEGDGDLGVPNEIASSSSFVRMRFPTCQKKNLHRERSIIIRGWHLQSP